MKRINAFSCFLCALLLFCTVGENAAQSRRQPLPAGYEYFDVADSAPVEDSHQIRHKLVTAEGTSQYLFGFANNAGEIVVEPIYSSAVQFNEEGYATVVKMINGERREGLIDRTTSVVIPCNYAKVFPPSEGYVRFAVGYGYERQFGYMNLQGEVLIAPKWFFAYDFSEGYAAVREHGEKGKYGYIDTTGQVVVAPIYDEAREFTDGYAVVGKADKYYNQLGLIDRAGRVVVPMEFYTVGPVVNGRMVVSRIVEGKERFGQMSLEGRQTLRCEWDYVSEFKFGRTWVGTGEYPDCRYVMLDDRGNEYTYGDYYDLNDSNPSGYYSAAIRDAEGRLRYGVLDSNGKEVIPFKYDRVTIYTHHHPTRGDLERVMMELNGETTSKILGEE